VITDRIDIHAHAFSEGYLRRLAAHRPDKVQLLARASDDGSSPLVATWAGAPLPAWDRARRLDEMDRDRVALEVLSAPTVYAWLDDATAGFCRELNDFQDAIVRADPDRFLGLVHLPVHEPEAARRELVRAAARPGVAGVVLGSNMGGLYPGDPALLPIWEAIDAAHLPVLIHPVTPSACFGPAVPPIVLFPCDTTVAAASIIYAGLFDRFPRLEIILTHYGGALPFLAARLDMAIDIPGFPPRHGQELATPPSRYVERFHLDTAQGFHRPAFECARAVVGIDHLLYGSDHFFLGSPWRARLNQFLDGLALSPRDRAAVLSENARALLLRGCASVRDHG
jgi:aminocarboxymuconate-semialdehyde decarboxylase